MKNNRFLVLLSLVTIASASIIWCSSQDFAHDTASYSDRMESEQEPKKQQRKPKRIPNHLRNLITAMSWHNNEKLVIDWDQISRAGTVGTLFFGVGTLPKFAAALAMFLKEFGRGELARALEHTPLGVFASLYLLGSDEEDRYAPQRKDLIRFMLSATLCGGSLASGALRNDNFLKCISCLAALSAGYYGVKLTYRDLYELCCDLNNGKLLIGVYDRQSFDKIYGDEYIVEDD